MIGMHFTTATDWDTIPAEVTHLRLWDVGVHWGAIHTGKDTYDWTLLDSLVTKAGNRHLTYVIAGCPRWLAKYPNQAHYAPWLGPGSNSMPYSLDEANKFAWNLATRYKGRIRAYEMWNEPQLSEFLFPYTDAECNTLAALTKRLYATIKAVDPAALVLGGSVLPRESSGGMKRARRYLSAMQRKGWNVDAFTCHIYPEVGFWHKRWATMLQDVVSTLASMGAPTKKLWVTETAFNLLGPVDADTAHVNEVIGGMYSADGGRFVYWYAWDRTDLGGILVTDGTQGWAAIKAFHQNSG